MGPSLIVTPPSQAGTPALQRGPSTGICSCHCRDRGRVRSRGKHSPPGRAGYVIVLERPTGTAARSAQLRYRALHGKSVPVRLFRLRWRPPAHEQRGRRPSRFPRTTTLLVRRWDVGAPSASRRPRRPGSQNQGPPQSRTRLLATRPAALPYTEVTSPESRPLSGVCRILRYRGVKRLP